MTPRSKTLQYYRRAKIEDTIFNVVNITLLLMLLVVTVYPFWKTRAISFNDAIDTVRGGITLWPRIFTLTNYKAVFSTGAIPNAFFISVMRTFLSTVMGVFLTAMLAFALGRREFVLRKVFTFVVVISMYVQAGLIPQYFLFRSLGLVNNFWVYVIPTLMSAFNFIVIRTYISTIPDSLVESARIDGAGDFRIFMQIILPLITPVLATIALFIAVGAWNQWFDTLIYCSGKVELHTLQYKLMEYLSASQTQGKTAADVGAMGMAGGGAASNMVTPVSMRAAITVVAAVPILFVYPFLQRHFVTGLNVGGVKE